MTSLSRAQIDAYERLLSRRRDRAGQTLARLWRGLADYDETGIAAFQRLAAPVLAGSKTSTVAASNAFVSRALGVPPQPISPALVKVEADLRMPFTAHWHSLKMGNSWEDSLTSGEVAADDLGDGFVHSVARRTGDFVADSAGFRDVRWERVPSPGACEWCQMVAGDRYLSAESADFGHVPCHCSVVPAT